MVRCGRRIPPPSALLAPQASWISTTPVNASTNWPGGWVWKEKLLADGVGEVIEEARKLREEVCPDPDAVDENLGFFNRHRHQPL